MGSQRHASPPPSHLQLTSPRFQDGETIPIAFTCEGGDKAPPLHWEEVPPGTHEGLNDWGRPGPGGPCPPISRHRYLYRLFALDTVLPDLGSPTRSQLLTMLQRHVIAETQLIGTYEKHHSHVTA